MGVENDPNLSRRDFLKSLLGATFGVAAGGGGFVFGHHAGKLEGEYPSGTIINYNKEESGVGTRIMVSDNGANKEIAGKLNSDEGLRYLAASGSMLIEDYIRFVAAGGKLNDPQLNRLVTLLAGTRLELDEILITPDIQPPQPKSGTSNA